MRDHLTLWGGLALMALGIFLVETRYETTNTNAGVTFVIDRWTGSVRSCQIHAGCQTLGEVKP